MSLLRLNIFARDTTSKYAAWLRTSVQAMTPHEA
jgi:hypothetical protein